MQRNNDSKNRKSTYNPNRTSYLSADGRFYCYEVWDPDQHRVVTQQLEVGRDLSLELTLFLDSSDRDMDLNDRYQGEFRDTLFDERSKRHQNAPGMECADDPWSAITDKAGSPEDVLCADSEPEDPMAVRVRRVIDEDCTDAQQEFFFEHFGCCTQLEEMRQEEAARTGKLPTAAAMSNRKNKIIARAAKALGVERVKRHKYPGKE